MGGRIAAHYAITHPENIKSLILESSNLGLQTKEEKNLRLQSDQKLAKELIKDYPLFLEHWHKSPLWGNIITNNNYSHLISNKLEEKPQALAMALESFSLGKQDYLLPNLIQSKINTLLITGTEDEKYCNLAQSYNRQSDNLNHTIISGGHNTHFDSPDEFSKCCKIFIK